MRFHEYRTLWSEMQGRLPPKVTEELFYATAMAGGDRTGNGLVLAEAWGNQIRPFENLPNCLPRSPRAGAG